MWVHVATLQEVPEGRGRAVTANQQRLVLFRVGSQIYALRDRCSHAGAPLSIGRLRGTEVTCAWHGWVYDVTTGESLPHNPPFDIQTHAVKIEGEMIYVDVPSDA